VSARLAPSSRSPKLAPAPSDSQARSTPRAACRARRTPPNRSSA
jgi:hypothetical protein